MDRLNRLLRFLELEPGNLHVLQQAVLEACKSQSWNVARTVIDEGLGIHPHCGQLLALSGLVFLRTSNPVEAEVAFAAAASRDDAPQWIWYYLACARFKLGTYALALEALYADSLVQAVPDALLLRARCLHHLNRCDEAIADCKSHLLLKPDDADAYGLLALLSYERNDVPEVLTSAQTALRVNPKQLEALLALGSMHADAGNGDAALQTFATLVEAHPDCGRGWLGLALARFTEEQLELARLAGEQAVALMPHHIGTWHVLAWVDIMRGEPASAAGALEHALRLDRNFGETHGTLAVVAALQGKELDATASIKRALRLAPQSMSAKYAELILLLRHGKEREALALFDAFLSRTTVRGQMNFRDIVKGQLKRLRKNLATELTVQKLH